MKKLIFIYTVCLLLIFTGCTIDENHAEDIVLTVQRISPHGIIYKISNNTNKTGTINISEKLYQKDNGQWKLIHDKSDLDDDSIYELKPKSVTRELNSTWASWIWTTDEATDEEPINENELPLGDYKVEFKATLNNKEYVLSAEFAIDENSINNNTFERVQYETLNDYLEPLGTFCTNTQVRLSRAGQSFNRTNELEASAFDYIVGVLENNKDAFIFYGEPQFGGERDENFYPRQWRDIHETNDSQDIKMLWFRDSDDANKHIMSVYGRLSSFHFAKDKNGNAWFFNPNGGYAFMLKNNPEVYDNIINMQI
jgi:hypothetical protein